VLTPGNSIKAGTRIRPYAIAHKKVLKKSKMRGGFRGSKPRANFAHPKGGDRGGHNGQRGGVTERRGGHPGQRDGFDDWRGEVENRRGHFNDWRGEVENRRGHFNDWRGKYDDHSDRFDKYDDRSDQFDCQQQAGRGRGRGRGKPRRQAKQVADARPDSIVLPRVATDTAEQHATDAPASKRRRPLTPDAAGQRTLWSALDLAKAVRTQSGTWQLGAARALKTERAPSSQTLLEAVRIAEAESLAGLACTIEAALIKEAKDTHAALEEYRDEMSKDAPPVAACAPAPAPAPAPAFVLDAAAIAMIGNQIIAQLKQ
jgi:hypothetical protein